jgi:ABC-type phosphate transport system substrate-binding protein
MKRTLATLVLGLATVGFVGCGQEAGTTTETTTTTPTGSTTVTSEKTVETSGSNPPAAVAPAGTEAPK